MGRRRDCLRTVHGEPSRRPDVRSVYQLLDIIDDHLTGLHVDEVSDDTVAAIVRARRAAGVSTATIRRDLTALSSVLGFAKDEKWRKGNPALEAMQSRRMKERRDPIVLPEDPDIERVIARAPGLFKHLIRAALLTGTVRTNS